MLSRELTLESLNYWTDTLVIASCAHAHTHTGTQAYTQEDLKTLGTHHPNSPSPDIDILLVMLSHKHQ